jgi:hypothetical protein
MKLFKHQTGSTRARSVAPPAIGLLLLAMLVVTLSFATLSFAGGPATPAKAPEPPQRAHAGKAAQPPKPAQPAQPANAAKPAQPPKPAKAAKPAPSSGKSHEAQHHVIICHRTGSTKNPYVVINVSVRAWLRGHQTHPMLDGRVDHLLKDPAKPGEKLSVAGCPGGANDSIQTGTEVTNGILVIDATSPTGGTLPATTIVNKPLVIVVHTTPNVTVTLGGAVVFGLTRTTSNKRGVARISVTPKKAGVLGVMVDRRLVKSVGVVGAQKTSGRHLAG